MSKSLVGALKTIPVFKELSPSQVKSMLKICDNREIEEGHVLCQRDSPAEEMYILLEGKLAVKKPDGSLIITVSPINTVGEMGIVTRQPRAVRIETLERSKILVVAKIYFDKLMDKQPEIRLRIYRNLIEIISMRILKENVRVADFQKQKRVIAELTAKVEILLEFLEKQGLDRNEVEAQVTKKYEDAIPKILIVDDEPIVRRAVKRVLFTYRVMEAENGKDALRIIEETPPDIVIADVNMPEMGGVELLNNLRKTHPDLPILGLSGYVDTAGASHLGFDGFLEKPLQLDVMNALIEKYIREN